MSALVLAMLAALTFPAADASNPIIAADPGVGSRVSAVPSSLSVALKDPVSGPVVLTVEDPNGRIVSAPQSTMISTNVTTDLDPDLPRGTYTVTYRLQVEKGPEGGSFQFVYGSGGDPRGLSTWAGYSDIPEEVALPDDDENAALAEKGEDPNQPEPTPSATPVDGDEYLDPDETSAEAAAEEDSSLPGWVLPLVGLLVLAGVGGAVVVARRRRAGTE